MSLTIAAVEDAWLVGELNFEEWKEEFEQNWFRPLGERLGKLAVSLVNQEREVNNASISETTEG